MSKVLTMCAGCSSKIRVPDKYLGQKIACPKCQGTVLVQDIESNELESDDQPRPVTKPAVTAPPQPAARLAPPPSRPRKPAPVVEVDNDFEEVSDDNFDDEVRPSSKSRGLTPKVKKKSKNRSSSSGGMNGGLMIKGVLMIVGAIVWFVVGWMAGFIYFYPPVLLVIGIGTCIKAMMGSDE